MKEIVYQKYGSPDILELKEVERPTPKNDEVLIKVRAAFVNPLYRHFLRATPFFCPPSDRAVQTKTQDTRS